MSSAASPIPEQVSEPAAASPAVVVLQGAQPLLDARRKTWPRLWEYALAFILGVCALLVVQSAWRLFRPTEPLAVVPSGIDLNSADVGTLRQLPGVGPHLAARIVDYRNHQGPFTSIDDLRSIHGIGPATLERLKTVVSVSTESQARSLSPRPTGRVAGTKSPPLQPLDLNSATREELMSLPGIGPVLAERIVEDRATNGPYRAVPELTRIRGIKGKTLEKFAPYLRVEVPPSRTS